CSWRCQTSRIGTRSRSRSCRDGRTMTRRSETILSLTGRVLHFGVRHEQLEVMLEHRAGAYRVGRDRPDFGALVGRIADAWKSREPVTVEVDRGVEIVGVE